MITSMVHAPLASQAEAIRAGALSSEALVNAQLERIARHGEKLHAYTEVYADDARAAAQGLDQMARAGVFVGPLHGVTVAVKDLFEVQGKPVHTIVRGESVLRDGAIVGTPGFGRFVPGQAAR